MATVAEILLAQGQSAANARRQQGQIKAGMWTNLAQLVGNTASQYFQDQREAPIRAQDAEIRDLQLTGARRTNEAADQAAKVGPITKAWFDAHPNPTMEQVRTFSFSTFGPELGAKVVDSWAKSLPEPEKPPEPFTLSPGQQRFSGGGGAPVASVPETPKIDTRSLQQQANDALKSGNPNEYARIMRVIKETASAGRAPEKATPGSFEQQIADALQRGDTATVERLTKAAELAAGARSRTQGRPVISGDANRIADLDTSLNDLQTLRSTIAPRDRQTGALIEPGATGTLAKIGTVLPNFMTNAIGWTTPKQKQATIDRVKQVIGKALEEGVLRKEDELKYEKILPTIYDPVDVVETKLDGLDKAITQRRQTTMDRLEDAGYDLSKFRARGGPQTGTIRARDPQGNLHEAAAGTPLPAGWKAEP